MSPAGVGPGRLTTTRDRLTPADRFLDAVLTDRVLCFLGRVSDRLRLPRLRFTWGRVRVVRPANLVRNRDDDRRNP